MIHREITYREEFSKNCRLDLYLPDGGSPCPLLVYFHGGGLTAGSKNNQAESSLCQALNIKNIAVASADYRLFPDARFPGYIEDCAAAAAWVHKYGRKYGNFTNFYIGGSSAGAYLSMMLCFNKKYFTDAGMDPAQISGFIFDAGQPTTHFHVLSERGLDSRRLWIDEAAPLYYIDREFSKEKLPHLLLIAADHDMPGRLEQNSALYAALLQFGYPPQKLALHIMKGCRHCDYFSSEEYQQLLAEFIR